MSQTTPKIVDGEARCPDCGGPVESTTGYDQKHRTNVTVEWCGHYCGWAW